ncbi:outer membrane beta-barrel protein [Stenotrophomonas sp. SORGH_AS_0321]|uniref:outer membrane protein n=1 Tax=Stenotrophomonas sp. SORGH_AS_0321 TaxID=3041787 RepID=UPI00285F4A49|nr:outer membrane beta-barrel protein [Stenotrophomonas sp. SORGH_AS_0321]MDR6094755.1 opacity protein-like surface antigen [Stenotrophomonas sp. SORGH_AS_0321]
MSKIKLASLSLLALASLQSTAALADDGNYYVAGRVVGAEHKAREMADSARPGIGAFVPGQQKDKFTTGSFAAGYQYGNGWRVEGEYTLPKTDTFTSGSTVFPTSSNVHYIEAQRLMANVYRDFAITDQVALYGSVGLGITRLKSDGWQGTVARQYNVGRQDNLSWSLGAGVAYSPIDKLTLDLGYRYVDMGRTESGWNAFPNARSLQDEKMSANLVSSEIYLGGRYAF